MLEYRISYRNLYIIKINFTEHLNHFKRVFRGKFEEEPNRTLEYFSYWVLN